MNRSIPFVLAPLALLSTPSISQEITPQLLSVQSLDLNPSTQEIIFNFNAPPTVKTFTLNDPQRIVFDFLKTSNQSVPDLSLKGVGAQSLDIIGDDRRLRAVLNVYSDTSASDRWDGNKYIVTLNRKTETPATSPSQNNVAPIRELSRAVQKINFQKMPSPGSGKLLVDLSHTNTKFEMKSIKGGVQIDFIDTLSPTNLIKKFDLSEYMTPVSSMEVNQLSDRTRITLKAQGKWEQSAYQLENKFILEVKPVSIKSDKENEENLYKGEKISLDFQNIEVRALIQLLSDFSGYNIIASDSVNGTLAIRLKNVPWDQALDLVLQSRALDKRVQGNIIRVAPQAELRAQEKSEAEFRNERTSTQPLTSESIPINYAKASDIVALITNSTQKILSSRGSAVVDPRTNTVFIQDVPERIQAVRTLLKKIDVPLRQVMIEARIVEASDTFGKSLGVRLGTNQTPSNIAGKANYTLGGNMVSSAAASGQPNATSTFNDSYLVNLPAAGVNGAAPGVFSLVLFNTAATKFLNMELSALVSDGRGQILSNPRIITGDKQTASIEQGTEIPYQQVSSAGATNVAFKKATLSLNVTPQITPDGKVLMQLKINKDSIGASTSAGPSVDTKNINTNILAEDGGTIVIGGIYTQDDSTTTSKVPFFGDLPVVGHLFQQKAAARQRRELLVFITPRIIADTTLNEEIDASTIQKQTIGPILMDPKLVEAQTPEQIKDLKLPKPNWDHK